MVWVLKVAELVQLLSTPYCLVQGFIHIYIHSFAPQSVTSTMQYSGSNAEGVQSRDSLITRNRTRPDSERSDQQSTGVRSIETLDTIMESDGTNTSAEGSSSGSGSGSHRGGFSRSKKCGCYKGKKGKNSHIIHMHNCVSKTSPFVINASCENLDYVSKRIDKRYVKNIS